ncbi:MAG: hypothetical protein K6G33_02910 [Ruminococcus sp.]|uniref:hypothetical protein n=1 Tax=Ruminococcus sp. TaxID=41978 RepID=UPI0025D5044E|nr:hypothetical protein [Ruminococcus sp.]MCR5599680.1 hypothetical protein [Ruminococcus sp.]
MAGGISALGIIISVACVIILSIISFAVYKAAYKRKINKRLAEGREADIKPMMPPVKFVIVTILGAMGGMILVWLILIMFFSAKMNSLKKDMAVYPRIAFYRDETLEDSLFAGYKFGDEIKGYNRFSKQFGDVKLEVYVTKNTFDMFPTILVASDYVGDKENLTFSEEVKYSFYTENWGNELCPDSLVAIDVGGYKGEFTLKHKVYYSDNIKDLINEPPDESYELDFRIHESGSIACPQLGLTVDSWD